MLRYFDNFPHSITGNFFASKRISCVLFCKTLFNEIHSATSNYVGGQTTKSAFQSTRKVSKQRKCVCSLDKGREEIFELSPFRWEVLLRQEFGRRASLSSPRRTSWRWPSRTRYRPPSPSSAAVSNWKTRKNHKITKMSQITYAKLWFAVWKSVAKHFKYTIWALFFFSKSKFRISRMI